MSERGVTSSRGEVSCKRAMVGCGVAVLLSLWFDGGAQHRAHAHPQHKSKTLMSLP